MINGDSICKPFKRQQRRICGKTSGSIGVFTSASILVDGRHMDRVKTQSKSDKQNIGCNGVNTVDTSLCSQNARTAKCQVGSSTKNNGHEWRRAAGTNQKVSCTLSGPNDRSVSDLSGNIQPSSVRQARNLYNW